MCGERFESQRSSASGTMRKEAKERLRLEEYVDFCRLQILRGARTWSWRQPASAALKLRLDMGLTTTSIANPSRHHSQLILSAIATMQKSCSPSSINSLRTAVRTKSSILTTTPHRKVSDISITRTGRVILKTQGGRSVLLKLVQLSFC
jgi:hypothetical protein